MCPCCGISESSRVPDRRQAAAGYKIKFTCKLKVQARLPSVYLWLPSPPRVTTVQELERLAGNNNGADGNSSLSEASTVGSADQARLALLYEELTGEHKALDLILDALKALRAQAPAAGTAGPEATPAPGTPSK